MLRALFTEHPTSVGESYTEHMAVASGFAVRMLFGGVACFLHGLLPFLFVKTGSTVIQDLHQSMVTHRQRHTAPPAAEPARSLPR